MAEQTHTPPPFPPPAPAAALAYAVPMPSRPGLVTAMGVISIVIGSMSLLFSLSSVFQGIGFYMIGRAGPAMFRAVSTAGGAGIDNASAAMVVSAFNGVTPLSANQRAALTALLEEQGNTIIPASVAFTPANLAALVQTTIPQTAAPGETAPIVYSLSNGALFVGEDIAYFLPSFPTAAGGAGLPPTGSEITAIINNINLLAPGGLNPSQSAAVQREFSRPSQGLVFHSNDPAKLTLQVGSAMPTDSGGLIVNLANGALIYLPSVPGAAAVNPANATPYYRNVKVNRIGAAPVPPAAPSTNAAISAAPVPPAPAPAWTPPPFFNLAGVGAILESVISLGLAIYVLVIGILVFRSSTGGRRHHLFYAWAKILTSIVGAVCWGWLMSSFFGAVMSSAPRAPGRGAPTPAAMASWMGIGYAMFCLLSVVYPVSLLFLLRSRSVREWYRWAGG